MLLSLITYMYHVRASFADLIRACVSATVCGGCSPIPAFFPNARMSSGRWLYLYMYMVVRGDDACVNDVGFFFSHTQRWLNGC